MSIRNYSDHAANERTFLAWVRTSIALTAFGFLIERFDLFLDFAVRTNGPGPIHPSELGPIAGLILIVAGVVMVVLSALRFVKTARNRPGTGHRRNRFTPRHGACALLALLGIALFFYLYHAVASQT